jgi:hypothetical protein
MFHSDRRKYPYTPKEIPYIPSGILGRVVAAFPRADTTRSDPGEDHMPLNELIKAGLFFLCCGMASGDILSVTSPPGEEASASESFLFEPTTADVPYVQPNAQGVNAELNVFNESANCSSPDCNTEYGANVLIVGVGGAYNGDTFLSCGFGFETGFGGFIENTCAASGFAALPLGQVYELTLGVNAESITDAGAVTSYQSFPPIESLDPFVVVPEPSLTLACALSLALHGVMRKLREPRS